MLYMFVHCTKQTIYGRPKVENKLIRISVLQND